MALIDKLKNMDSTQMVSEIRSLSENIVRIEDRLRRSERNRKSVEEELSEYRAHIETLNQASLANRTEPKKRKKGKTVNHGAHRKAVIAITDNHLDEVVKPEEVSSTNEHNLEVFLKRKQKILDYIDKYLSEWRKQYTLDEVVLWLGGDHVSGIIHDELKASNDCEVVEAVAVYMVDFILELNEVVGPDVIICNVGNHGRISQRMEFKGSCRKSFEWGGFYAAKQMIEAKNKSIDFRMPEGYLQFHQLYDGMRLRLHHGNSVRYGGGVGGLTIPLIKKIQKWNESNQLRADFDILGHFHQTIFMPMILGVMPCSIGYNEYALSLGCQVEPPAQAMLLFDETYGCVGMQRVFCG